jgi:hypothetical protein
MAGVAWTGMVLLGSAGTVWRGQARSRNGMARQAWLGKAAIGNAMQAWRGPVGTDGLGNARQAWLGRPGLAPQDWQGTA